MQKNIHCVVVSLMIFGTSICKAQKKKLSGFLLKGFVLLERKLLIFLFFPITVLAQNQIGQDIFPEAQYEESGWYVSLSADGQTVAVGAHPRDANNNTFSKARAYHWNGQDWIQKGQTLEIAQLNTNPFNTRCRVSLSADANILAISSPFYGDLEKKGITRIFHFNGTQWQQMGQDIIGNEDDLLGYNISISADGNIIAVLSAGISDYENNLLGNVTVFQYNGSSWQQIGQKIEGYFISSSFEIYSMFQGAISLSNDGTKMVIGTMASNPTSGQVRIYEYTSGTWQQLGETMFADTNESNFGWDVGLSGDGSTVAIGMVDNYAPGKVQVFELSENQWVQKGENIIDDEVEDFFGHSVSMSDNGNVLAVGAPLSNNITSYREGSAKVFQYDGTNW